MNPWPSYNYYTPQIRDPKRSLWIDEFDFFEIKNHPHKAIEIRLYPYGYFPVLIHWIKSDIDDLGKYGGKNVWPFYCPDFDPKSEESTAKRCPVCLRYSSKELLGPGQVQYLTHGYVNAPKSRGRAVWEAEPMALRFPRTVGYQIKSILDDVGHI